MKRNASINKKTGDPAIPDRGSVLWKRFTVNGEKLVGYWESVKKIVSLVQLVIFPVHLCALITRNQEKWRQQLSSSLYSVSFLSFLLFHFCHLFASLLSRNKQVKQRGRAMANKRFLKLLMRIILSEAPNEYLMSAQVLGVIRSWFVLGEHFTAASVHS